MINWAPRDVVLLLPATSAGPLRHRRRAGGRLCGRRPELLRPTAARGAQQRHLLVADRPVHTTRKLLRRRRRGRQWQRHPEQRPAGSGGCRLCCHLLHQPAARLSSTAQCSIADTFDMPGGWSRSAKRWRPDLDGFVGPQDVGTVSGGLNTRASCRSYMPQGSRVSVTPSTTSACLPLLHSGVQLKESKQISPEHQASVAPAADGVRLLSSCLS